MKLIDLMNAANAGYPDGYLANYFHPETGKFVEGHGDTLAEFVARELSETFSEDCANDEDVIATATRCMENAISDLQATISALDSAL